MTQRIYSPSIPILFQDIPDPGEFPLNALPKEARAMAQQVADLHGVPIELAGMAALSTMSAAAGKAFELVNAVSGRKNWANLYVVVAAPRGGGKSSVELLAKPLLEVSSEMEREFRDNRRPDLSARFAILERKRKDALRQIGAGRESETSEDELRKQIKAIDDESFEIQRALANPPSLWQQNITSERLASILSGNSETTFLYSAEGGEALRVFAGKYRRDGAGDFDLLLAGYTGDSVRVERGSRAAVTLRSPCIAMLFAVQPQILKELMGNPEALQRGMLTRMLAFACDVTPQEDDGLSRVLDQETTDQWNRLIRKILTTRNEHQQRPAEVTCSPEARNILREFHNESIRLRCGACADIQAELTRWRENACRCALTLAIGDAVSNRTLTAGQAERAVRLTRWASLTSLELLTIGRGERIAALAERVTDVALRHGGEITLRDLRRRHGIEREEARTLCAMRPHEFHTDRRQGERGAPSEWLVLCQSKPAQSA